MNVISYTALHYGRDYLYYAIKSVIDHVDAHYVLYTSIGSHGHRTSVPCPETRDELYAIAQSAAGGKLVWIDGVWPYEGAQRDHIHVVAPDADVILVVDADEVWPADFIQWAIMYSAPLFNQPHEQVQRVRVPMVHFWRSFQRAVVHDPAYPVRIIYPKVAMSETTLPTDRRIAHFGYAQRPEIVEYKQETHGHRNEWRRDVDWFADKYLANAQQDTHPVGSEYWNPEPVDPWDFLPEFMRNHPYASMEIIE